MTDKQDNEMIFGAAVAILRQMDEKLRGVDKKEVLWDSIRYLEGKKAVPPEDAHNFKLRKAVEQMMIDNTPK